MSAKPAMPGKEELASKRDVRASAGRPKIVFHLGLPKTGTTTIQAMLESNRDVFGDGIVVSARDHLTLKVRRAALQVIREPSWRHWRYLRRHVAVFAKAIREITFDVMIISDENILGMLCTQMFNDASRADYGAVAAELDKALRDYDVSYIVYERDREPWRRSCYNQSAKTGKLAADYEQWSVRNSGAAGPDRIIEQLRKRLKDRLTVQEMSLETVEGSFLGKAVLELAGVKPEVLGCIKVPSPQNQSLPSSALAFIRALENAGVMECESTRRKLANLIATHVHLFVPECEQPQDDGSAGDVRCAQCAD